MSDPPPRDPLDLREQLARIDRALAENQKLAAEASKFNRYPWFLITGAIIAALATRAPEIMRALGLLP